MDIYFSDFFKVSPDALEQYGAFDISLLNDLPLFIDPFLLFNSDDPQYQKLHEDLIKYMRFLKGVSADESIKPALLKSWFTFPEVKQNWLGYSQGSNQGRGLGRDFALALHRNLRSVFRDFGEETVTRASHLEKLCLIRSGIGRDNISDFTTNLIVGFLAEYTQTFAREHITGNRRRQVAIPKASFNYETRSWVTKRYELPFFGRNHVLLTPKDILTKDETWISRSDLLDRFSDVVDSLDNAVLRSHLNEYLIRVMPEDPKASQDERNKALTRVIEALPEVLDYYIRGKEEDGDRATSISNARVKEVKERFVDQVRQFVDQYLEPQGFYRLGFSTFDQAYERVQFLKDVIENKGGHRFFYVDGNPIEREADVHILYRLTWFATKADVSREVNDGRGPADFKISQGAADKTIVEFKLAKNTQLERTLAKQAEIYEKASDATHPSIKAILYFTETQLERVQGILKRLKLTGSSNIVLIDARSDNKPSASKA